MTLSDIKCEKNVHAECGLLVNIKWMLMNIKGMFINDTCQMLKWKMIVYKWCDVSYWI